MSYLPDAYARRARIAPAVIVAMPIMVLAAATAFVHLQLAGGATLVAGAYLVLVEQLSRDAGRRIQDHLWKAWDGHPTLHRFRYRNSPSIAQTDILHHEVADLVGWELPTQEDEKGNPVAADAAYDAAIASSAIKLVMGSTCCTRRTRTTASAATCWASDVGDHVFTGCRPRAAAFALVADGSVMHRASVAVVLSATPPSRWSASSCFPGPGPGSRGIRGSPGRRRTRVHARMKP